MREQVEASRGCLSPQMQRQGVLFRNLSLNLPSCPLWLSFSLPHVKADRRAGSHALSRRWRLPHDNPWRARSIGVTPADGMNLAQREAALDQLNARIRQRFSHKAGHHIPLPAVGGGKEQADFG